MNSNNTRLADDDREFATEARELVVAGQIDRFRKSVIEYAEAIKAESFEDYVSKVSNLVTALKTYAVMESPGLIVENPKESYKNRNEVEHWLQSQINEILACGRFEYSDNRLIEKAYRYLAENITDAEINLNSIADRFSVSNSHLSRLFKKQVGRNYVEIVSDIRLALMLELLNTTNLKDRDIGEKIGIYDPHYLSIWFKKVTGLSPSMNRKRY